MKKALLFCYTITILACQPENKLAYVDSNRIIREYYKSKTIGEELTARMQQAQSSLDSFKLQIQDLSRQSEPDRAKIDSLKRRYEMLSRQYQNHFREQDEKVSAGILEEVNRTIKDYGKKNGYTLIFGVNATGNIVYADSLVDVTDDILKLLNQNQP